MKINLSKKAELFHDNSSNPLAYDVWETIVHNNGGEAELIEMLQEEQEDVESGISYIAQHEFEEINKEFGLGMDFIPNAPLQNEDYFNGRAL